MRISTALPRLSTLLLILVLAASFGCASAGGGGGAGGGAAAAPAAPPPPAVVGTWNLVIEVPTGNQEPTFTVSGTADSLTGVMVSPQGELPVENVAFKEGMLTFTLNVDAGGQQLALDFSGTVDGDSLSGVFNSDFGEIPVSGTRANE